MNRHRIPPFAAFAAFALLLVTFSAASFADERRFKIGVLAPLSGDVAPWGEDTRRALVLANRMLGGGRFEFVFEDDRCLGKDAVNGAHKLLSVDKVDFGMIVCTEPTLSAAPIFNRARTVVVAPGATGAAVREAGDFIFRTWPSDDAMVKLVYDHIAARYKRVAVLTESRGFPQEFTRSFIGYAEGMIELFPSDFLTTTSEYRTLVLKSKSFGPEALVISTDSDRTLGNILREKRNLNWDVPAYGNYIVGTPAFLAHGADAAEGVIFGDSPDVECGPERPGCEVYETFVREHGTPGSSPYMVASAISSFIAIAQTARSGADPREHLYRASFRGPIGEFRFDDHGDVVGPRHTLKVVRSGRPIALDE